jgi:hypothetical protein
MNTIGVGRVELLRGTPFARDGIEEMINGMLYPKRLEGDEKLAAIVEDKDVLIVYMVILAKRTQFP